MQSIIVILAHSLISLLDFLLLARVVLSWLPQLQGSKLSQFLFEITEPMLYPIRQLLQRIGFLRGLPLDFSPIVVFIVLEALRSVLVRF